MAQYDNYHIDRCDALEYLVNNWGEFPTRFPEGGPAFGLSEKFFKSWRFVLTQDGEIIFGNGLSPCIRRADFEHHIATVGVWS